MVQGHADLAAAVLEHQHVLHLGPGEQRFGAVLVGLGFDILTFAVARPARNLVEATAIAAEHFAVSPDNIYQGVGTIRDYARELVHTKAWQFWWD